MRTRATVAFVAIGLVAAASAGCAVNPATGQRQLSLISETQEVQLGTEAAPEFEKEFGGPVAEPRLQAYVKQLGAKLAAVGDRPGLPWEFTLLASDVPNAFALPGGKIFVTAGLFRHFTNERQLAAVIGHEIGHVTARHSVNQMQQKMGADVLVKILGQMAGDRASAVQAGSTVAANMVLLKYSRGDESQADGLGVKYMEKAGYNPWGMVEMLEILGKLGGEEKSRLEAMFLTHPLTSDRINDARSQVSTDYKRYSPEQPDPNAASFVAMRRLLPPG